MVAQMAKNRLKNERARMLRNLCCRRGFRAEKLGVDRLVAGRAFGPGKIAGHRAPHQFLPEGLIPEIRRGALDRVPKGLGGGDITKKSVPAVDRGIPIFDNVLYPWDSLSDWKTSVPQRPHRVRARRFGPRREQRDIASGEQKTNRLFGDLIRPGKFAGELAR